MKITHPIFTLYRIRLSGDDVPAIKVTNNHIIWAPDGTAKVQLIEDVRGNEVVDTLLPHFDCSQQTQAAVILEATVLNGQHTGKCNPPCRILKIRGREPNEWNMKGLFNDPSPEMWMRW